MITPDERKRLEAIRARFGDKYPSHDDIEKHSLADIRWLLDALDEQDKEIEWCKKELDGLRDCIGRNDTLLTAQHNEIARLKAENERMDDERRMMTDQVAEWGPQIVCLKSEVDRLKAERSGLGALIGTVRQMFELPLRNVSDITPEQHSQEIGGAVDRLKADHTAELVHHGNAYLAEILTKETEIKILSDELAYFKAENERLDRVRDEAAVLLRQALGIGSECDCPPEGHICGWTGWHERGDKWLQVNSRRDDTATGPDDKPGMAGAVLLADIAREADDTLKKVEGETCWCCDDCGEVWVSDNRICPGCHDVGHEVGTDEAGELLANSDHDAGPDDEAEAEIELRADMDASAKDEHDATDYPRGRRDEE